MDRIGRRTIATGVLVALVAAPAVASGQSLHAGVVAGGGWDSNLSGASGAMPVAAGGYGSASASVGAAVEPSSRDELSLEGGFDATRYPAYAELDVQRPWVELAWLHDLGERITLRFGPTAGLVLAGDPKRDGWEVGGMAAARLRLGDATALRVSAGYRHRDAEDPAFASDSFRAKGGIERDLWRGATLAATYTLDLGQDTFYRPASTVATALVAAGAGAGAGWGGGGGGGPAYTTPDRTFGDYVAYAADRTAHTAAARLTQRFPGGFALDAGWAYEIVLSRDPTGAAQDYRAHLVTLELGWRR